MVGTATSSATLENTGTLIATNEADIAFSGSNLAAVSFRNHGTFIKTGAGATTDINVPMTNSALVRVESGTLRLQQGSANSGTIEIFTNATLALSGGSHTFESGVAFPGNGQLLIQRPITLLGAINFGDLNVTFDNAATVTGAFGIANGVNGILRVNKTMTFPGDVAIAGRLITGGTTITMTVSGSLSLAAAGTIENPGTVRVAAFNNQGGSIIGNPPVSLANFGGLQIAEVGIGNVAKASFIPAATGSPKTFPMVLECLAAPGRKFVVESSADLFHWTPTAASIEEIAPGVFRATLNAARSDRQFFFRLRALP